MRCPNCGKVLNTVLEEIQATLVVRKEVLGNRLGRKEELLHWDVTYEDDKGHRAYICDHCLDRIPDEHVDRI